MTNPWNLTPAQAEAPDAIIAHDGSKQAARALGISEDSIGDRVRRARRKMGLTTGGHHGHILLWDRWRQSELQKTGAVV